MNNSSSGGGDDDGRSVVPPGYRFHPTEEELIGFFLKNKLENKREDMEQVIPVADFYCFDPWLLPEMSGEPCRRDGKEWFFFCPRQEREAHGGKPTRTTPAGYWKATGSPSYVFSSANRVLGVKRTMVFYRGRAHNGTKTKWKLNEYRAVEDGSGVSSIASSSSTAAAKCRTEFSLCRMYTESGCMRAFDRRPAASAVALSDGQRVVTREAAEGAVLTSVNSTTDPSAAGSDATVASQRLVRQRGQDDHPSSIIASGGDCDIFLDWF